MIAIERKKLEQFLEALENAEYGNYDKQELDKAITAIKEALAQPEQEPVLQDIEQYRMQMAGISTAALGYWKDGDGIHPDYDTVELRDVAKLYAKYDELYKARWASQQEAEAHLQAVSDFGQLQAQIEERNFCPRCGKRLMSALDPVSLHTCCPPTTPTGWDNGLSQDYDKKLGAWFSEKPNAKEELRARMFDDYGNKIV